jgi:hypothetical protein
MSQQSGLADYEQDRIDDIAVSMDINGRGIMKRLSVLVLILFTIVLIVNAGLLVYAQAQTNNNPLKAYGLELCEGNPCFYGVQPGMAWDRVLTTLQTRGAVLYSRERLLDDFIGVRVNRALAVITPNNKRTQVVSIQMQLELTDFKSTFPELGNIIAQYGQPCGMSLRKDGLFVRYPHFMIDYHTINQRVSLHSEAASVLFSDRDLCPQADYILRWSGFTRLENYKLK